MLVFNEGFMKGTWRESMGLIRLTSENTITRICVCKNQVYKWVNAVEYTYVNNGGSNVLLHVVTCDETCEETSTSSGKI